ncbi:MAG TPA: mandelate racemase/muconate lactonizing enzyme family protein [Conexibacter sp.]|jgi:L-alanine-DL-glutamate epimerase-like enolase superfamily enzyme|nr:mandelate racemase/muconate lactonizing enzyme family protein [Conexibacter sp.]
MTSIAALDARLLRVPLGAARGGSGATQLDVVLVTLTDSDGCAGTGFTYALTGGAEAVLTMVEATFREPVVGSSTADWDRTWERLRAATHRIGRGVSLPALSALDIAVWDLRAHAAELPLHRLLGSRRDAIPVYGSGRATNAMSVEELVAGTQSYLDEGYRAVKLRVGTRPVEEEVARMAAVREAVGPQARLMVDCNERLDYASAVRLGAELAQLGFHWLEEPLPAGDLAGHARLAAQLDVAIAAGEHLQGRHDFAAYLRSGAASVLQPDAPLAGGITETMRIATVAEALGATISPHFLPELHVHVCLAAASATYVEHFPLLDDLLAETLVAEDGLMRAPERPGHGIAWDPDALERFEVARSTERR